MKLISHVIFHITKLCFSFSFGWKGLFSWGNLTYRGLYYFSGSTHSNSRLSWDDVDINRNHYRSISPRARSYGFGIYNQDTMLNLAALRASSGRTSSWGSLYANGGVASGSSISQVSALGDRPAVFWDGHRYDYGAYSSDGTFTNSNSPGLYSFWRLSDTADVVADVTGGDHGVEMVANYSSSWDDHLFAVNGQGKGNTTNGSPLSKIIVSTNYTDFAASRPLLMSLFGGLPRGGGDVVSKDEPGDAFWRAGDQDYYLNYYPKYDRTAKKLLAKDDGYDWFGLHTRTQIDGTKPLTTISASAESVVSGYSRAVKNVIYMKLYSLVTTLKSESHFSSNSLRGGRDGSATEVCVKNNSTL